MRFLTQARNGPTPFWRSLPIISTNRRAIPLDNMDAALEILFRSPTWSMLKIAFEWESKHSALRTKWFIGKDEIDFQVRSTHTVVYLSLQTEGPKPYRIPHQPVAPEEST